MNGLTGTLEAMKEAVLDGRLAEVEGLSAKLETILPQAAACTADELRQVRLAAEGVARCLRAALGGMRAARRRVQELAAAEHPQTYGGDGRKADLVPHRSRHARF